MRYEKIVTLFDTADHADAAKRNLEAAGFPAGEISVVGAKTLAADTGTLRQPGLWHRLFGKDIEEHEAIVYGRTVESGGCVLTVRVPESDIPRAMGILNAHNAVDVEHRAAQQGLIEGAAAGAAIPKVAAAAPVIAPMAKEQVLRLAEEQLNVGKRLVQEGTTRIRRFVTTKPVEQQVTLHEEHAEVVHRAVTDPDFVKDIDWSDKTIEVNETAEEPVVSKSARVAEEVVISKKGTDRVQTVKDTVRRQEVEVEPGSSTDKPLRKAG